jgi:Cu(I)/Ag(I) efflux system membrane protein CusA/SilA
MTAIGGMRVSQSIEGLERYPINMRYPQSYRDSVEKIRLLPLVTKNNQRIALSDVADIYVADGPPAIKSENARLNGWTLVDIEGRDLGSYVAEAQRVVAEQVELPSGYSIAWSGQYEYMVRAKERLIVVIPLTLGIIVLLLYINFRNIIEVMIIMGTLPFALIGGFWLMYLLKFDMSVAVGVGFIALAGVTVEIGVLMLVYLNQSYCKFADEAQSAGQCLTKEDVKQAVMNGAGQRVRPIVMTVAAIVVGLIPIMFSSGTGSEVMQRIAGPMIGGMLSSVVLTLLVIPAIYYLWKSVTLKPCPSTEESKASLS